MFSDMPDSSAHRGSLTRAGSAVSEKSIRSPYALAQTRILLDFARSSPLSLCSFGVFSAAWLPAIHNPVPLFAFVVAVALGPTPAFSSRWQALPACGSKGGDSVPINMVVQFNHPLASIQSASSLTSRVPTYLLWAASCSDVSRWTYQDTRGRGPWVQRSGRDRGRGARHEHGGLQQVRALFGHPYLESINQGFAGSMEVHNAEYGFEQWCPHEELIVFSEDSAWNSVKFRVQDTKDLQPYAVFQVHSDLIEAHTPDVDHQSVLWHPDTITKFVLTTRNNDQGTGHRFQSLIQVYNAEYPFDTPIFTAQPEVYTKSVAQMLVTEMHMGELAEAKEAGFLASQKDF
ncbi:hypothetical protein BDK51DRAFT_47401 [Blyttiomyces helicus]|uniref:Uncharacterized protein n=1 Tax=Blyttiomyces helicus TaxID=388810 RepID=A0A4P9WNQ0_9FUNG|nr:hypothetical protein BDK51DRAFT_47401 [Blyttiomyces helicus]|eukprot:RKO94614.1 hypothetical protein BDK51DRAFT_47401 [Blyttiomyces helicus]